MMTSSIKVCHVISTTNYYQKLQARAKNVYVFNFRLSVIVAIARGQFYDLGAAENPTFADEIVILPVKVQII